MLQIALALVIFVAALTGLLIGQKAFDREAEHHPITLVFYYTNLSNVVVGLYFLLYALWKIVACAALDFLGNPGIQLAVMLCILVTGLIFHFVLLGGSFADWNAKLEKLHSRTSHSVLLHYATPALTLVFWFAFADHTGLHWYHALLWLLLPLAYFVFLVLLAKLHGPVANRKGCWPYGFIDLERLGLAAWVRNLALTLVFFALLGFVFYGVGVLLS